MRWRGSFSNLPSHNVTRHSSVSTFERRTAAESGFFNPKTLSHAPLYLKSFFSSSALNQLLFLPFILFLDFVFHPSNVDSSLIGHIVIIDR